MGDLYSRAQRSGIRERALFREMEKKLIDTLIEKSEKAIIEGNEVKITNLTLIQLLLDELSNNDDLVFIDIYKVNRKKTFVNYQYPKYNIVISIELSGKLIKSEVNEHVDRYTTTGEVISISFR